MTVTIDLASDLEAELLARAAARGLALPKYLELLVREQVSGRAAPQLSPAERAAAWRESVKGLPETAPLPDEAISRESIYRDRG